MNERTTEQQQWYRPLRARFEYAFINIAKYLLLAHVRSLARSLLVFSFDLSQCVLERMRLITRTRSPRIQISQLNCLRRTLSNTIENRYDWKELVFFFFRYVWNFISTLSKFRGRKRTISLVVVSRRQRQRQRQLTHPMISAVWQSILMCHLHETNSL